MRTTTNRDRSGVQRLRPLLWIAGFVLLVSGLFPAQQVTRDGSTETMRMIFGFASSPILEMERIKTQEMGPDGRAVTSTQSSRTISIASWSMLAAVVGFLSLGAARAIGREAR